MSGPSRTSLPSLALSAGLLALAIANGILLFSFAWLRETPMFWHADGGYPFWLREVVQDTFYPLLVVQLVLAVVQTLILLRNPPRLMGFWVTEAVGLAGVWFVLGTTILLVGLNNVDNFMNGRDLHEHLAMTDQPVFFHNLASGE